MKRRAQERERGREREREKGLLFIVMLLWCCLALHGRWPDAVAAAVGMIDWVDMLHVSPYFVLECLPVSI
jgi:hypothetical protein